MFGDQSLLPSSINSSSFMKLLMYVSEAALILCWQVLVC